MRRGHDLGEIWVERKGRPCLAWGYNKAVCRAVKWSSRSRSVHITGHNACTYSIKLLGSTNQYERRYLNRSASESAFWNPKHHSWGP